MITIFRSDSAMVVMKGRARDVGIDFLFESQSVRAAQKHSMQAVRSSPPRSPPHLTNTAIRHRQGHSTVRVLPKCSASLALATQAVQ